MPIFFIKWGLRAHPLQFAVVDLRGDLLAHDAGVAAIFDDLRRDAHRHAVGRQVFRHDGSRAHHTAFANRHAIDHNDIRAEPDIILDSDALRGYALILDKPVRVAVNVVDRRDLHLCTGVYAVANAHAALPANAGIFAEEAVPADC